MKKRIQQAQKYLKWQQPNQAIAELRPLIKNKQIQSWIPFHMMGIALSLRGNHESSAKYLQKALENGSQEPETYHMLSVNQYHLGHFKEAEQFAKEALDIKEDFLKAWLNLGSVYRSQAKLEEALKCYQKANHLDPRNAGVAFRIGEIYRDQGDLNQALKLFDITLKIDEDHTQAILEKADIYKNKGKFEEAEKWLNKVLTKHGEGTAVRVSQAELYKRMGDYDQAIDLYEKLLEKDPKNGGLRVNYALCLQELSRFDKSEENYRLAIKDMPGSQAPISNYLMGLHYNPKNSKKEIYEEHVRLVKKFLPQEVSERAIPVNRAKNKRLKVGFVSGGFRRHPVGFMIAGALERLSEEQFKIYCYTTNNKYDFVTQRIHQNIDVWRSVVGYNSEVVDNLIREDEIDILVDLSGHAEDSRLQVMAREPAPLIVKWVGGLFNTTGLKSFDYLITDWYESPEGEEEYYTEKLVRLPDDYISFTPPAYAPDVASLPVKKKGYVTFGCFNNPTKVNKEVLKRWAGIMKQIPESRLFLKSKQYDTASFRTQITEVMEEQGISRCRIEFQGHSSHNDHLDAYNKVDIALDPWPYSGGLTTCEALYMGVPVITLPGPTFAGRHSTTHLINAGLEEFVAESWEEYTHKAVELANNRQKVQNMRSTLRDQLLNSHVCDGKRFGAHLSVAFRKMWEGWVEGYEKGVEGWQDHIEVKALSKERIDETTTGPELTAPIEFNTKGEEESPTTVVNTKEDSEERIKTTVDDAMNRSTPLYGEQEAFNANGQKDGVHHIETKDGVTVCTPADINMLTPYVLLEQEEWFEPELNFVREYLKPGMKVVDAGAAFGAYSLPMTKHVGKEGAVYAFEPGSIARKHLEMSKLENEFNNLEVIGRALGEDVGEARLKLAETPELSSVDKDGNETVSITTLDAWWSFAGRPEVDFIKVDVNGMEPEVLKGSNRLLTQTEPVILASIGENKRGLEVLHESLNGLGYQLFEYIPGPKLLVGHDLEAGVDPYMMNVIAIKTNRIEEFKKSGWIYDESVNFKNPDENLWEETLRELFWASSLVEEWKQRLVSGQHEEYLQALNLVCAAEQIEVNQGDSQIRSQKGVMLLAAAQKLISLFNSGSAGISAAMTYVRVMNQLGKQGQAVEMMKELMETINSGGNINTPLPFLPPLPIQDKAEIQTDFPKWLTVRIVEAWIMMKDASTYLSEKQEQKMLEALEGNLELSSHLKRKVHLLKGQVQVDNKRQVIPNTFWEANPSQKKANVAVNIAEKLQSGEITSDHKRELIEECQARISADGTDSFAFFILVNALLSLKTSIAGKEQDLLLSNLKSKGWVHKYKLYNYFFSSIERISNIDDAKLSVVIVSNKINVEVLKNLKEVDRQRDETIEVIFVSNGLDKNLTKKVRKYVDALVHLNQNTGACMARNFGALFSSGDLFMFIDDDGIPEEGMLKAHQKIHDERDVFVARGVYLPKKKNGGKPWHYDLGPRTKPAVCFLEGNTSFRPKQFFEVGGWNDKILVYHEGLELSYRYYKKGYEQEKLIYFPDAILRHDYVKPPEGQSKKQKLLKVSHHLIHAMYNDLDNVINNWPESFKFISKKEFSVQEIGRGIKYKIPPKSERILHLHIGSQKTGTTAIQNTFHHNREKLLEQGYQYPGKELNHHKIHFASRCSEKEWLWHFKWFDREKLLDEVNQFYLSLEEDLKLGVKNRVISSEFLFISNKKFIREIINYLNNFFTKIKVYVFVRNPIEYYSSFQQERIKTRSYIKSPYHFHYNFREVIEAWSNFAEVKPIKYSSEKDSCELFCESIGIDLPTLSKGEKRKNESLSVEQMVLLEQIQKSIYPDNNYNYKPHLALIRNIKPKYVHKPKLKEFVKPIIRKKHKKDMEWLKNNYSIVLDTFPAENSATFNGSFDQSMKEVTVKDIFQTVARSTRKYEITVLDLVLRKMANMIN